MDVMTRDPPEDPDAQHTVTDFLDYTEYLPSDLVRSLTLIGNLDESYLAAAGAVHDLSKEYGSLPSLPPNKRQSAQALRQHISHNLDYAISCRESAHGEATRLFEMVDRHYNRLTSIITKLRALPKPPSRDPTPVPRSPKQLAKRLLRELLYGLMAQGLQRLQGDLQPNLKSGIEAAKSQCLVKCFHHQTRTLHFHSQTRIGNQYRHHPFQCLHLVLEGRASQPG